MRTAGPGAPLRGRKPADLRSPSEASSAKQPEALGLMLAPRLYLRYVGASIRSQLQYRASFVMLSLGQALLTGVEFVAIWALFDRFGSLGTWALAEVGLLYGMVNVTFALTDAVARGFDLFGRMVKSGDFDRVLLRPRGTAFQVAASEVQIMRVGRFAQGLAVLVWAATAMDAAWDPAKVALLAAAILGGVGTFFGLFVLQATLAFWTTESLEIVNVVTYGGVETTQYPLDIYKEGFQRFFTFVVPLAFVNYVPALAILDRTAARGWPAWAPWIAPLVGVLFLLLSLQVWRFGVRHYRSTGS